MAQNKMNFWEFLDPNGEGVFFFGVFLLYIIGMILLGIFGKA